MKERTNHGFDLPVFGGREAAKQAPTHTDQHNTKMITKGKDLARGQT